MTKNLMLLTGAGFTKNFGGFLAREMWSKIFNNPLVQKNEKIRQVLSTDFDFESVYAEVLHGSKYSADEQNALIIAVEQAYKDLDDSIKDNNSNLDTLGLGELISLISSKGSDGGCLFTLNQDLYLERKNGFISPGVNSNFSVGTINLPNQQGVDKLKSRLNSASYIKLHGSYGWASANGGNQMVIGKNKFEDINREPLLKWYLEIFENAVYEGDKKLLIIGYGFKDNHINDILLKGVQEHGLSIYVISTTDPESFKNILEGRPSGVMSWEVSKYFPIWKKGIKGYFPYSLKEIFPPDRNTTSFYLEIKKALES